MGGSETGHNGRAMASPVIYLKLALTALFWGGTFVAGRILAGSTPPYCAALLRFCFALAVLVPLLWRRRDLWPKATTALPLAALLGATGVFGYNAFFFFGLKTVDAGRAALIVAVNPVFIASLSAAVFGERLGRAGAAGVAICLCGAGVVISRGDPARLLSGALGPGEAAIFGCVACWTTYTLIGKRAMRTMAPLCAVTLACLAGAAMLVPFAMAEGLPGVAANLGLAAWLALAYLGLCGTALGFIWYYQGVAAIGPARSGVFINLVPVSALAMGAAFLGEKPGWAVAAGAVLVVAGVYLTNRAKLSCEAAPPTPNSSATRTRSGG